LSAAIFDLNGRQVALGVPLTFATVILGGVTYTLLHCFDGWLAFDTPSTVLLSVIFLFFQYLGPGMIKMVLTLRTGNAWVHVWADHAIAPHALAATSLMVRIFHL
jgi:hypothetical protein